MLENGQWSVRQLSEGCSCISSSCCFRFNLSLLFASPCQASSRCPEARKEGSPEGSWGCQGSRVPQAYGCLCTMAQSSLSLPTSCILTSALPSHLPQVKSEVEPKSLVCVALRAELGPVWGILFPGGRFHSGTRKDFLTSITSPQWR